MFGMVQSYCCWCVVCVSTENTYPFINCKSTIEKWSLEGMMTALGPLPNNHENTLCHHAKSLQFATSGV